MARKDKMIEKAQKFIQKGNLDKALAEYRAVAAIDPNDITIGLRIGELCVKTGQKEAAIKEYSNVARANTHKGFYLKAIAVYKQILKLDETILEVHYKLAELYGKQKLVVDAISEFSYLANYYEKNGKPSEVVSLYKMMVDVDPENVGVRIKLAEQYQRQSFDKDALVEYALVFARLIKDGEHDRAERVYVDLYNAYPNEPQVVSGLADIYKNNGDDARYLRFTRKLFDIHSGEGNTFDAITAKEDILGLKSDDPEVAAFVEKFKESCGDGSLLEAPEAGPSPSPSDEEELQVEEPAPAEEEIPVQAQEPAPAEDEEDVQVETPAPVEDEEDVQVETPASVEEEEEIEISLEGFDEDEEEEEASAQVDKEAPADDELTTPSSVEEEISRLAEAACDAMEEAQEDAPVEEETVLEEAEELTVEEEAPVQAEEEAPVEEETALEEVEELSVEEEAPAQEDAPVEEETVLEEAAELSVEEEAPAQEDAPVEEETALEEAAELSVEEEAPAQEEAPVEEETVLEEAASAQAEEEAPVEEETALEEAEELTVEEEAPAQVQEDTPVEEETVLEEAAELSVEEEAPAQEDAPVEEELPPQVEEEASAQAEEEAPVEEETALEEAEELTVEEEAVLEEAGETAEEAISDAIDELMDKMESGVVEVDTSSDDKVIVEDGVVDNRDEYVDLSAELGIEEGVDPSSSPGVSTRTNETYDEFRTGLKKQLGSEDSETHYNLGIAYMEMELFKEASKEFKLASKDSNLAFDCFTRLGLSATAESNYDEATTYYLKAMKVDGRTEDELRGCMYELALAYEAASNREEAVRLFQSINEVDPGYREVAEKVKSLASGGAAPVAGAGAMHIPMDDGLIEVELL